MNLTFEQAVELALKNYPAIRAAQARRQSAEAGIDLARAKPNPILITGSLHFAGEVLAQLRCEPAAFEECAQ